MTCEDTRNAISSPEGAFGRSPRGSPDGRMADLFGLEAALVSHSRSLAREQEQTINGICGPTSIGLLPPADQRSPLANRLVARLAMVGSTELPLIWKVKATPAKRSIFRLAPSMRRTSDNGSIGLQSTWPTPTVADIEGGRKHRSGVRNGELLLNGLAAASPWATPCARDHRHPNAKTYAERGGGKKGEQLNNQVVHSGPITNGASAPTARRGALSPAFVFWLMGFPDEWECSVSRAMQSFHKSRPKSSQR